MDNVAVSMRDVWVRYNGAPILEDITLTVKKREIVSIVGPNGSGKSTLLKAIMGFVAPYRGNIEVLGMSPEKLYRSGAIGYLPQNMQYDPRFPVTAANVVAMSRYARKGIIERLSPADRAMIDESLEKVEMSEHGDTHFGSLSGGQKQRVLIARALAIKPEILILDEPSTGLDAVAQEGFYRLLVNLRERDSLTILIVSHDIGSVSAIVDKIACLKTRIHFHGSPAECIPSEALERVFGKDVYFLHHDQECESCKRRP